MVPCHSCHIYEIWTSRSKKVWGMLKSHQLGVAMQVTKGGDLFIGKAGSHYVIMLYSETLWQVLLGIYCKRFYRITLFTILLLFYMFKVAKAKSATQSVLMILTLNGLFQKIFQVFQCFCLFFTFLLLFFTLLLNFLVFYFTPENSISLTPPFSLCLFFSIIVFVL